ncbi:MAG: hypothetical protein HFG55_02890 [Lachnospiraceae bacterium]|nr:hypothetical protein [Lachnospiraceae bacterium]
MKKMIKRCLVICSVMIMVLSSVVTAYAQSGNGSAGMIMREYQDENSVGVEASPRGQLISTITLQLSNEGYRTLGVYSEILCHQDMKSITMSINLQRLVDGRWKNYNTQNFEWTEEDDDHLSMAIASYEVGLLPAGSYRLSAAYVVYNLDGSLHESKNITSPSKTIN